jgi:TonB family protein
VSQVRGGGRGRQHVRGIAGRVDAFAHVMRTRVVAASLAVHLAIVIALLISGFWDIERLGIAHAGVDIAQVEPFQEPPAGGPTGAPLPKITPKAHPEVVTALHQPKVAPHEQEPVATTAPVIGDGSGAGSGEGSGTGLGSGSGSGSGDGSGTCEADCGSAAPVVVKHDDTIVSPTVLTGLRIAGDAQIHPPDNVKTQMQREGKEKLTAVYKICVDADGSIFSVKALRPTGFPAYDQRLVSGMQTWRYRPFEVNGKPVRVCSTVTFIYATQ